MSHGKGYRSLARAGQVELVVRRSRFVAYARPVAGEQEALAWIGQQSARHPEATHHVPAYVVGLQGEKRWCSDAGEPAGTAGRPVLEVLERHGLTQVAALVCRYFGGVKLGAAGLARAYAAACAAAVEAARPCVYCRGQRALLKVAYDLYGPVRRLLTDHGAIILEERFEDRVVAHVWVAEAQVGSLAHRLADRTAGALTWPGGPWEYRPQLEGQPPR